MKDRRVPSRVPATAVSRRAFVASGAAVLAASRLGATPRTRPVPSPSQLLWQRDELAIFVHFGVNTFTDREWGDGRESPAIFNPAGLDARQWARSARAAGARAMVLTAKHHDGFCLWPTRTTEHSVRSSPFRSGGGDVVREFVDACRAEGLRPGLYCSPWDRNAPAYGDSPRYNDMYMTQLTELLTWYGPLHEVWFDGANGEGPNGRRQVYDWPRTWALVRRLQPEAVVFSDAGPDVRWIGNEKGIAGDPNWSTMDPAAVPYPGADGPHIIHALQHGDPNGSVWRPGEADVSIRPGWFYHPAQDAEVKTADQLAELYCLSVGRNAKLLLNVPPTPAGLFHDSDVARLAALRAKLGDLFAEELTAGRRASWRPTGPTSGVAEVELGRSVEVSMVDLAEDVTRGQVVSRYRVEGRTSAGWVGMSTGTTIGMRKLDRIEPRAISALRVGVEGPAQPERVEVRAW